MSQGALHVQYIILELNIPSALHSVLFIDIISLYDNIIIFRFNLPMPIYVNMVRDAVERVISWYYYVRALWYFVERKRAFPDLPLPDTNWLKKVRIEKT